jgi:hypothetical protein
MAQVKLDELIDHLSTEVKKALDDALTAEVPNANVNMDRFFQVFKQSVYRHCSIWERVPDRYVKMD